MPDCGSRCDERLLNCQLESLAKSRNLEELPKSVTANLTLE
jgi:hypothetical protein